MADLGLIDKKNKLLKNLSVIKGFSLADPPVKINDNLKINNHLVLDKTGDVIDEKIFIKFFGLVDNSEKNKKENKKTKKLRKKQKKSNKSTKKIQ